MLKGKILLGRNNSIIQHLPTINIMSNGTTSCLRKGIKYSLLTIFVMELFVLFSVFVGVSQAPGDFDKCSFFISKLVNGLYNKDKVEAD